jgi:L-alanine-DL-glutamate epimerase-like enolase superfamily enzyme
MKITGMRTRLVHLEFRNCVLVMIYTDADSTGFSETVMKRKTLTIEQSILQLARYLVGKDPTDIFLELGGQR